MVDIQPSILALVAATAGLGLLAFAVVTTTAFIKVSVVLFLIRNALGTQSIPPNIVLYGAALILTVFIGAPVFEQTYNRVTDTQLRYQTADDWLTAAKEGSERCAPISKSSPLRSSARSSCRRLNISGRRRCAPTQQPMTLRSSCRLFDLGA